MQELKSKIRSGYKLRLILIAAGCLFWSAWCVKDAMVTYPFHNEQAAALADYQANQPNWEQTWPDYAAENGYERDPYQVPDMHKDKDILTQWIQLGITLPVGLWCGVLILISSGKWVAANEHGLAASGGVQIDWNNVTNVDTARWMNKGLAIITYDDNGASKTYTLDDWKYERQPVDMMFDLMKSKIASGLIPDDVFGIAPVVPAGDADTEANTADADNDAPADEAQASV